MAAKPQAQTIVMQAARKVLQPMGLEQRDRSGVWLDDHGWWMVVVEFQPSSWLQGSYLNVGCQWLWQVKDHVSFDEGYRVRSLARFGNDKQSETSVLQAGVIEVAQQAADEVAQYRNLYKNVRSVCSYYQEHAPVGFWPNYNAAIAFALAGEPGNGRRFLKTVLEWQSDSREWVLAAQTDAEKLGAIMPQTSLFRATVIARIQQTRELLKLPAIEQVDFG